MNTNISENPFLIRKLGVFFVAEITGIDLSQPLCASTVDAISTALSIHEVLIFPNQKLTGDDLLRLGGYFGELSIHPFAENAKNAPELIAFDYKEGNPPVLTDMWHSDETFRECPPMGTMLYSKIVPDLGGDTCFASMSAAYDSLSDKMQQYLAGLEAVHDIASFNILFPHTEGGKRQFQCYEEMYPPVSHPIVCIHPVTGKKILFVNPHHTRYVKGMEERESRALLDTLFQTTSILEFQYRHRWKPNTLLFWDNRSVQHAAVHDYYPQKRVMERVTIKGDRPLGASEPANLSELRKFKTIQYKYTDSRRPKRQFEED